MIVPYVIIGMICLLFVSLLIYSFFVEPYDVRLSRVDVRIPDLPKPLEGVTICHISDTHTSQNGRLEEKLLQVLREVHPDLCVVTGDIGRKHRKPDAAIELISKYRAKYGVFAVFGNNDYRLTMPIDEFANKIRNTGVHLLENQHFSLYIKGQKMHIIGVEDPYRGLDDLDAAMSGTGADGFRILLAHSPDILKHIDKHKVDLILAGHTHGGQVKVPGIGPLWLHCRYHLGISDGYYSSEMLSKKLGTPVRTRMYVSRGIGSSTIQARFRCPPEVSIIRLIR